ncbi:hypothetical protein [Streptomyces tanashiensis]|uniref:Uncharacterized protein n=1 Tax=Streptomyces tanashiensis TaxID=67367 RepID=A0ABY6R8A7_9ACTN|nr:hypothetical protein [Streptomyces tanashiensis]UZX26306.1 hypothetical protein LDH80_39210 [Streptomyces tanashiensis]
MNVTRSSRVTLHPLLFKEEEDSWVVGRMDTGEFVELPHEAVTFLRELNTTSEVRSAWRSVQERHGQDIDALTFVGDLIDLGFVSAVDDRPVGAPARAPSLARLRAGHVRWVFSRPAVACVLVLVIVGWIASALRHDLFPSYHSYFVVDSPSVSLAWNTVIFLTALGIHEFWHLAAARADNVYARIGVGTRLQFLVAQTTVSGLWGSSRHVRIRVYLAGVVSDLVIVSVCSITISLAEPTGFALRALKALMLALLLSVAQQFALYMRTDMYFVLQELLGCKNLYADSWDYTRYALKKAYASAARRPPPIDPTLAIPRHERKPVKLYSAIMPLGSIVSLAAFAYATGPILVSLFVNATEDLVAGSLTGDPNQILDGALVIGVEGTLQALFLWLLLTKHGPKIRRAAARLLRPRRSPPEPASRPARPLR